MTGAVLFAGFAVLGVVAVVGLTRAAFTPRTMARTFDHPAGPVPPADRPCAVYEIDTTRGLYIGHGYDPHERIMQSHRRTAWWARTVTAQRTMQPDRVDWYPSKEVAHAEEVRRIRAASPRRLENKIHYRQGAAK